jgi:GxxExxY protein
MHTESNDVLPDLTWRIVGSAIQVHRELGPGLLERTYRSCLVEQLRVDGLRADVEVPVPLAYRGVRLDSSYRADIVVEGKALVELKAVDLLLPVHSMQLLTYLKLCELPVGLLINFNVSMLKKGIRRFVNTKVNSTPIEPARR